MLVALLRHGVFTSLSIAVMVAGCAPSAPATSQADASVVGAAKPTVLRLAKTDDVTELADRMGDGYQARNSVLINGFLTLVDDRGAMQPYLALRLPSQDDGTWVVHPDGTMQMLWALRPEAKWQDGQPLTAHDVAFAYRIYRDRDLRIREDLPERFMSSVVARDDRTVEVNWAVLYFAAGRPRFHDLAPLPRHLLEELYDRDKEAFSNSRFWTTEEYVGAGPYRVAKRDPGVSLTLTANPYFFLGKPRIDTIEITFAEPRAIVARLLAGDMDMAEYPAITTESAAVLRNQWSEGKVYTTLGEVEMLLLQQRDVPVDPQPALKDVRVRRALMHAIDRDALAELATDGISMATDVNATRDHPLFARLHAAAAKYPYDPRRAAQLLGEAGWAKGPDGMVRNGGGELFDLQMYLPAGAEIVPTVLVNFWRRVGIDARPVLVSKAAATDEFKANFPGISLKNKPPLEYHDLIRTELPSEQNRWRGRNPSSWVHPEYEVAFARFNQTVNPAERDDFAVELERILTADVGQPRLYYQVIPAAARSTVRGIMHQNRDSGTTYLWNVHEWTID